MISKNKFARYSIFEVKENFNKFNENKNSIFSYESKRVEIVPYKIIINDYQVNVEYQNAVWF